MLAPTLQSGRVECWDDRRIDSGADWRPEIDDTGALLSALHAHLVPGGRVTLADLDTEDGSFHPPGTEGVFHHGFDRDRLTRQLADVGFVDVELGTACVVHRDDRSYPVFLVTATKA